MIIGIDIGTSFSSVAYLKDGKAEKVKPGASQNYSVPSAVFVKNDGTLLIGQAAVRNIQVDSSRFKDNFKRDFGTDKPYPLGGRNVTPDEIYTEYFRYFKDSVEKSTGAKVDKAYITHPVGYSESKRLLLKKSANYAGLMNIEFIDEPTAAALSFFADHKPKNGETLLVYDLGGGTLDLTLAVTTENGVRLLTEPLGDMNLGGIDFDRELFGEITAEFSKGNDLTEYLSDNRFVVELNGKAVDAKLALTDDTSAYVSVNHHNGYLEHTITRERYDELISSYIARSCELIEKIAKNAGLTPATIDRVLLVGGSSRIPLVTTRVERIIGKTALKTADPELAVCMGAVLKEIYGGNLGQKSESKSNPQPDSDNSLSVLLLRAESGDAEAQSNLGVRYINGQGVKPDKSEAFKWFTKAAAQGNPTAQYNLGLCYENGNGVGRDSDAATEWYKKAAAQGNANAQMRLDRLKPAEESADEQFARAEHFHGEKDYKQAFVWYSKAAERGHAEAQLYLGICYQLGLGVTQDYRKGIEWHKKSAEQGLSHAQYMLGESYYSGQGVQQDYRKAVEWLTKSAKQGHVNAQELLEKIGKIPTWEDAQEVSRKIFYQWGGLKSTRYRFAFEYSSTSAFSSYYAKFKFPILQYDNTGGQNWKNGYTVTSQSVIYKNLWESAERILLSDITGVRFADISNYIYITTASGQEHKIYASYLQQAAADLLEVAVKVLREYQ
ncbi:MAG: Hsp70 family protein [Oscillospiraceae bacterium]|jgi:TPR repeat protein/actin-like ATPase involved in cell morphogenesis|nr:Hsp70 family protein [Oscillospiraceae bacterium]